MFTVYVCSYQDVFVEENKAHSYRVTVNVERNTAMYLNNNYHYLLARVKGRQGGAECLHIQGALLNSR